MKIGWSSLTFSPDAEALAELREAWSWRLPANFEPVLFSVFGDVFFRAGSEAIRWLNTGTAEIVDVAESWAAFQACLSTEAAEDWFLPQLVSRLHAEGKIPGAGQCYTYAILPAFAEGKFETWNFKPVPAAEHFSVTGKILREIEHLPDGNCVRLVPAE